MKNKSQKLIAKRKRREKRKLECELRIQKLEKRRKKHNRLRISPEFDRSAFNNGDATPATQRVFKKLGFNRKAWAPSDE